MSQLIAIEGIDGSGKGTQTKLLAERLRCEGFRVAQLGFPRYSQTFFGARVGDFLNGRFGQLWDLPPFLIALLFAGDRLESRDMLVSAIADHDVVLLDRYVASNVAHQSSRCPEEEQLQVQEWIEHVEYAIHKLPRPTLNILLDIPVADAQQLILRKQARDYTNLASDLQEADAVYLEGVRSTYRALASRQTNWHVVSLVNDTGLATIDAVHAELLEVVLRNLGKE